MRTLNNVNMFRKASLLVTIITFAYVSVNAQCATWIGSSDQNDAENAHSIYRAAMKTNDFEISFENWEKAYNIAPAADGNRDFHFTDGIKLYKQLLKKETDAEKKKEYIAAIIRLYDEASACYEAKGIKLKCDGQETCYTDKLGYLAGRKGFDMYYELNSAYGPNIVELEKSIELGGNNTEYIVFEPLANMVIYNFQKGKADAERARAVHKTLNDIADHNVANNERYGNYYQTTIDRVNSAYRQIEREIFDCDYFINQLQPKYDADPDNIEIVKDVYNELKRRGCEDSVPIMAEMKVKYEVWAEKVNAEKQAEFEANNPAMMANKKYKEGDFQGALDKYDEAIAGETDPEKLSSYYFSKASILFRKMDKYNEARSTARKAAEMKEGWGRPYMLIGDMYGSTARSCGDSWNQRLAILAAMEKYSYAKSIDPEVADDANDRLGKYRASMPAQDEGFMRGVKEGTKESLSGCWIGESVTVRYRK